MTAKTPTRSEDGRSVSIEMLRELPFFAGLSDAHLAKLLPLLRREQVGAGVEVIREEEPALELRVILSGRLSLTLCSPGSTSCLVHTLARGELLGWSALFPNRRWIASAKAIKDSSFLVVPGAELRALCERDHDIGYRIMSGVADAIGSRLQDTRLQLLDMFAPHG